MRRLGIALACLGLLGACGLGDDEGEEAVGPPPTAPKLVGRVATVHRAEGFVLVEGYGEHRLGEGLLLSGLGNDGRTSTLVVTGERMGRFAAADLKSGDVRPGDLVYARPMEEEREPEADPAIGESNGDSARSP